jgi:hypothetical protein
MFGFTLDDAWKWASGWHNKPENQQGPPVPPGLLAQQQTQQPPQVDFNALQDRAQSNRLLNMGLGILAANGPSLEPRSPWQGVFQGVQAGQQAYDQTLQGGLAQAAARQQLAQQRLAVERQRAAFAAGQAALAEEARRRNGGAPLAVPPPR